MALCKNCIRLDFYGPRTEYKGFSFEELIELLLDEGVDGKDAHFKRIVQLYEDPLDITRDEVLRFGLWDARHSDLTIDEFMGTVALDVIRESLENNELSYIQNLYDRFIT